MTIYKDDSKINKTVGIRPEIWEAVLKNDIINFSKFINELLEDALFDRELRKAYLVKRVTELQEDFLKIGWELQINLISYEKEKNLT